MNIAHLMPPDLVAAKGFAHSWVEEPEGIVIGYEAPRPGALYVIGGDFAYGLQEGDLDVFIVGEKVEDRMVEVGIAFGKWGERADRILYAMHRYWNGAFGLTNGGAFICGERQVGMFTLRRLWDDYGVRRMYRPREKGKIVKPVRDMLGHPRTDGDMVLAGLRTARRERRITFRTKLIVEQSRRVIWIDKRLDITGERSPDEDLKIKLVGGGSPDFVMAAAYLWLGGEEVFHVDPPPEEFAKGTLGDILDHNQEIREAREAGAMNVMSPRMRRHKFGRGRGD